MEPLPICPACGADVEPHWHACATCGYRPDGGDAADADPAMIAGGSAGAGRTLVDPFEDLRPRTGGEPVDDPFADEPTSTDPGDAFPRGPVTPDEVLPVSPPQPGDSFRAGAPAQLSVGTPAQPSFGAPPPFVPAAQFAAQRSSTFGVNKVVVVVASVIGVLVLLGGILTLTRTSGTSSTDQASTATATTPPATRKPISGLAGVAESTTIPVPSSTSSTIGITNGVADCDSRASVHSSNGKGTIPCGGGFQVDFPGRPEIVSSGGDVAGASVTWTKLTSTDPDVGRKNVIRYAVVFAELPADPSEDEAKAAMTAAAAQLGGAPSGDRGFQGDPGLAFKGRDDLWTISGIAFVHGRKVIALAALGLEGLQGDELEHFWQTFVWLP